tara:strand:- start:1057 stop:1383 length:327 start_codon:yes stop_codon:yes gene_type:complete
MAQFVSFVENLIDAIERNFTKEFLEAFERENFVHYKVSIPATCAAIRLFYYTTKFKNSRWKYRDQQYNCLNYLLNDDQSKWEHLTLNDKVLLLYFEQLDSLLVKNYSR